MSTFRLCLCMMFFLSFTQVSAKSKDASESVRESLKDITKDLSRLGDLIHEKSGEASEKISPAVKKGWERTKSEAREMGEKIGTTTEKGVAIALERISSVLHDLLEKLEKDKKEKP